MASMTAGTKTTGTTDGADGHSTGGPRADDSSGNSSSIGNGDGDCHGDADHQSSQQQHLEENENPVAGIKATTINSHLAAAAKADVIDVGGGKVDPVSSEARKQIDALLLSLSTTAVEECKRTSDGEQQLVVASPSSSSLCRTSVSNNADTSLQAFRDFMDKYLELPSLLDKCLVMMVEKLTSKAQHEIKHGMMMEATVKDDAHDGVILDGCTVEGRIWTGTSSSLPYVLSALYAISKVRGYKRVQTLLPHTVADVEVVLWALKSIKRLIKGNKNRSGGRSSLSDQQHGSLPPPPLWESVYTLWNWLAILSKVPFDCRTFMSTKSTGAATGTERTAKKQSLTSGPSPNSQPDTSAVVCVSISELFDMAFEDLADTGAVRDVASRCLASWLVRPDIFEEEQTTEQESATNEKTGHGGGHSSSSSSDNNGEYSTYYYYNRFQNFACDVLKQFCGDATASDTGTIGDRNGTISAGTSEHTDHDRLLLFTTLGVLQVLVTTVKLSTSSRDIILRNIKPFVVLTTQLQNQLLQSLRVSQSDASVVTSFNNNSNNLLLRRYLVKWWTRLAVVYLKESSTSSNANKSWRYKRGYRSLHDNLHSAGADGNKTTNLTAAKTANSTAAKRQGQPPTNLNSIDDNNIDNDDKDGSHNDPDFFVIPDEVEQFTGYVVAALRDVSTPVRWSAAKGLGRIMTRLPAVCGEDVLDAILIMFDDIEQDNGWHGACLALAELSRRGLIPVHRFDDVIPKIVEAIQYDVPRRQTSVGQNVRDAACYAYWATARAYAPGILKPFVSQLCQSVVTTFLFDREVNCRRAASAAFQEMVGRQGADNVPHGIGILTAADYYSLGNRTDAYITIAPQIASFVEYRASIVDCIYEVKLFHWDRQIRELASKSLGCLTEVDVDLICKKVVPYVVENCVNETSMLVRHGSTLGLAEIIMTLGKIDDYQKFLPPEIIRLIAEAIPTIEKKRLYRGKGGEYMRQAACRLIESISTARLPLSVLQTVRLLDSIDVCLSHPSVLVQEQACKALASLLVNYFPVGPNGPSERLQNRVVGKYSKIVNSSINPSETRGFSLALGFLPAKLLAPSPEVLDMALSCLCHASHPNSKVGTERDAETRKNSLTSLARIVQAVDLVLPQPVTNTNPQVPVSPTQLNFVFLSHLRALGDYNVDQRGDIGSMCRQEAMRGLVKLSFLASGRIADSDTRSPNDFFSEDRCLRIVKSLIKQFCEKLDYIRAEAAHCLLKFVREKSAVGPFVAKRKELLDAFRSSTSSDDCLETDHKINWSDPSVTFSISMKIANIEEYFECVINGIVLSVGGLTRTVADSSLTELVRWTRSASPQQIQRLGEGKIALIPWTIFFVYRC